MFAEADPAAAKRLVFQPPAPPDSGNSQGAPLLFRAGGRDARAADELSMDSLSVSAPERSSKSSRAYPVSRFWPFPAAVGTGLMAWNAFANGPFGLGVVRAPIATLLWLATGMAILHYLKRVIASGMKPVYRALAITGLLLAVLLVLVPVVAYGIALEFNPKFYLAFSF